jgi:hypothetical protein
MADQFQGTTNWLGEWNPNFSYVYTPNSYVSWVGYQNKTYVTISIPTDGLPPSQDSAWGIASITSSSGGNITITTPDGKSNTVSTFNLLNGANVNITSDGAGNITISAPTSALPSVTNKTGYLLSNNGTNANWINSLTNVVNIQNGITLDPTTATTHELGTTLSNIYSSCNPFYKSQFVWNYTTNVPFVEAQIPANTKKITLFFINLKVSIANSPRVAVLFGPNPAETFGNGYTLTYGTQNTTGSNAGNYNDRLINLNQADQTNGLTGSYTITLMDNVLNSYMCAGSHGKSGNPTYFTQTCYFEYGTHEIPQYININSDFASGNNVFTSGKIIVWFQ